MQLARSAGVIRPVRWVALVALAAGLVATGPAAQASAPRFGQVLLHAADWTGGVDVRSDSLNGCPRKAVDHGRPYCEVVSSTRSPGGTLIRTGIKYQATELVQRLLVARGWLTSPFPAITRPSQMYTAAPAAVFDHHLKGEGYTPVPGDVIVWNGTQPRTGGRGQVAVVDRVSAGTVRYVQQGAPSPVGTLVLGGADIRHVIGYLHARANTASIPGTQTPAPNAVGDEALTSFVDPSGALQLFVLTSTGVVHDEQLPGHAWTSEVVATGQFRRISAFAACGSLELFAINAQGVERLTRTAGAWSPAQLVAAGTFTGVTALVEAGGDEDLFTLSVAGLRHYRLQPGASWVGEPVAKGVFTQISAVQDPATRLLHLFAIDGFGIDHFADLPGTPWGREALTTGDFTQVLATLTAGALLVVALDADGVNGYERFPERPGWVGGGTAVQGGRYGQVAALADPTGQAQLLTLSSKGVLAFSLTGPPLGVAVVTGSFSQLSADADPVTGALHAFLVSRAGIVHAESLDGSSWTTEDVAP
jgi:hypothetical protein